ncbi:hypothetical protein B0H14DRAFT_3539115, partial [Mycena olivaceomarginata]
MSAQLPKPLLTGKRPPRKRAPKKQDDTQPKKKRGNPGNFSGARLEFLVAALPGYLAASAKGRGHVQPFVDEFMGSYWKKFAWYEGLGPDGRPRARPDPTIDLAKLVSLEPKDEEGDPPAVATPAPSISERASATNDMNNASVAASSADVSLPAAPTDTDDASATSDANNASVPASSADASLPAAPTDDASVLGVPLPAEEDDDPEWKSTGGVNPTLRGAIQVDVTEKVKHWFSNRKSTANRTSNTAYQGWLEGFRRPANPPRKLALH